jgi:DNA-binding GntR family transcriptional regulator
MEFERHCPIVDLIAAGDAAAAHRFLAEHMATAAQLLVSRMTETAAL